MSKKNRDGRQGFGGQFNTGIFGGGIFGINIEELLRGARAAGSMPEYMSELLEPVEVNLTPILEKEAGKSLMLKAVNKKLTKRMSKLHRAIYRMAQEHAEKIDSMKRNHDECHDTWDDLRRKLETQALNSGAGLSSVDDLLSLLIGKLSGDGAEELSKEDLVEKLEEMRDVADDARHRAEFTEGNFDPTYQSRRDRRKSENQPAQSESE